MRRRRVKQNLGNAISLEDALSIMVVVFVLFIVFFIPMVNIDKMKLEEAQKDVFWQDLYKWISSEESKPKLLEGYQNAFELSDLKVRIDKDSTKNIRYIQAVDNEDNITVIEHKLNNNEYISLYIPSYSKVVTYNHGNLAWSKWEKVWFTIDSRVEYEESEKSLKMKKDYRTWVLKNEFF